MRKMVIYHARNNALAVLGVAFSFLNIGISAQILTPGEFGLFSTLYVLFQWFNNFDGGVGNQLRNQYTLVHLNGDTAAKKALIKEGYRKSLHFVLPITVALIVISLFLDLSKVFKIDRVLTPHVVFLVLIGMLTVYLRIIIKLYYAMGKPEMTLLLPLMSHVIVFCVLQIFSRHDANAGAFDGLSVTYVYILPLPLLLMILTIWYLRSIFKEISPARTTSCLSYKDGFFYVIFQVMSGLNLVIVPFVISALQGLETAGTANIYIRYFQAIFIFVNIFMQLIWINFSIAKHQKNAAAFFRFLKIAVLYVVAAIAVLAVMFFAADFVFKFWIGGKYIDVPNLKLLVACITALLIIRRLFTTILQSAGEIFLSAAISTLGVAFFISALMSGLIVGVESVLLFLLFGICLECVALFFIGGRILFYKNAFYRNL